MWNDELKCGIINKSVEREDDVTNNQSCDLNLLVYRSISRRQSNSTRLYPFAYPLKR